MLGKTPKFISVLTHLTVYCLNHLVGNYFSPQILCDVLHLLVPGSQ